MRTNQIFSNKKFPDKDFCVVWVLLNSIDNNWSLALYDKTGNEQDFYLFGSPCTEHVIAWKYATKAELRSDKGHKELTKKEKIFISSLDDKNKEGKR